MLEPVPADVEVTPPLVVLGLSLLSDRGDHGRLGRLDKQLRGRIEAIHRDDNWQRSRGTRQESDEILDDHVARPGTHRTTIRAADSRTVRYTPRQLEWVNCESVRGLTYWLELPVCLCIVSEHCLEAVVPDGRGRGPDAEPHPASVPLRLNLEAVGRSPPLDRPARCARLGAPRLVVVLGREAHRSPKERDSR